MQYAFSRIRLRSFFVWMILGTIVTLVPLSIVNVPENVIEVALQTLVFFVFPLLWLFYKTRNNNVLFTSFFDKPTALSWKLIIIATAMGMFFAFGISFIQFYILAHLFPDFLIGMLSEDTIDMSSPYALVFSFISACIFAPIMEEVIFRGFFLNRMTYKWGIKRAIIISSLIFGLGHFDVIGAFLFGVIMCLLYIKTRNIWTNIAVHALNNFIATVIQFSSGEGADEVPPIAELQSQSNLWIGLVVILISFIWLIPFIRRNWRTVTEVGVPCLRVIDEGKKMVSLQKQEAYSYSQVILAERLMAVELPDEAVNQLRLEENDYVKVEVAGDKIIITKDESRYINTN
ncbi:CPBP family glutamic-type intramembrane protease [Bacillus sp. DX1.1]|uniref:CPBP family intramembrane glutamic endopeptidase n=1 Tax=unclassified Bacillus (in: firmicutes) TaxID=185979 RepID=UPI00257089EC|nr:MULTISPECIES: CPBP family intramembrane glutamic endopeptidase [unclassified Bacillus (in: firmicutes)]MDM5153988.1 CPBP family glutamic-type intramembrane protease [Bacillus sp. DX1.1]WJE84015.1 CPBP family glutamic-type intramembrane protease [Bacillus sp. DX3.1]